MSIMVVILVRLLEGMFALGALGCVAVLILTSIEDVKTLLGHDERPPADAVTRTALPRDIATATH